MNIWVSSALLVLYLAILGLTWIVWSTELIRHGNTELSSFSLGLAAALLWPVTVPLLIVVKTVRTTIEKEGE